MEHFLKIQKQYFNSVLSNEKTFEIRKNDRDYRVGDKLILSEIYENGFQTGRLLIVKITYILFGPCYGLEAGFCIMSVKRSLKYPNPIHLINGQITQTTCQGFDTE